MVEQPTEKSREGARAYLRLIMLGAVVGIPAALLAALFLAIVHWVENWLWDDLPAAMGYDEAPWFLILLLPVVGGVLVWAARRFLPGDGGHHPINGLSMSPTPYQFLPSIALAAIGTLSFGLVLGPEAPLIAMGSAVGMIVNRYAKLEQQGAQVVATAGSFSAVSALFGGPLVAGVLLLEAGISAGAALLPLLVPGVVAAAVGYLLFVGLGDWGGLPTASLSVPGLPDYDGTRVVDLLLAVVVGVLAALLIGQVRKAATVLDRLSSAPGRMLLWLLTGGLAVGVLALVVVQTGVSIDQLLFSGQNGVPLVIEDSVPVLLVVIAAKALAYAITLGCGFRGGPIFPAIFLGVAVASLAVAMFDSSVTWAVAVGAAAGMTAGSGLLFSSLLFSALLVGTPGFDAMPASVFAAVAAWLTSAALTGRLPGRQAHEAGGAQPPQSPPSAG